jgi:hypothetical protein
VGRQISIAIQQEADCDPERKWMMWGREMNQNTSVSPVTLPTIVRGELEGKTTWQN